MFNSDSEDEIQKKSHAKEKPVPLPYRKDSSSETSEEEDSSDSSESEGEESSRPAKVISFILEVAFGIRGLLQFCILKPLY